jgi:squalene-hopene/tetraprenyl-beta-curcumene cyclase
VASNNSTDSSAPRLDRARLQRALAKARAALLAERGPHGHWEGELSSSALSTATAVTALELWQRHSRNQSAVGALRSAVESGLQWLAEHQNADGGWGDTTLSFSNISTTALCWAAFGAVPGAEAKWPEVVQRAEAWLAGKCSVSSVQSSDPKPAASEPPTENWKLNTEHSPVLDRSALITAIIARYGKDRTFSVPILTMCALAGRLGEGKAAWRRVIQLPFELAALPHKFFAALRLPVVSYALPALIAIGQVRHHHLPTRNPLTRLLRNRARAKTLRVLERIQPPGGGFLEATPLTSFVTMSLAGSRNANHPVALQGVEFLLKSMRADGSWPIDTNLATWVTTLAVNALGPSIHEVMSAEERGRILDWLLAQQYRTVHPYTNAAPGGWAWTDLPGGVPDADDTAGALLALKTLSRCRREEAPSECGMRNAECGTGSQSLLTSAPTEEVEPRVREAAIAGVKWLLDLQNRDGGIPTFCRGWTNLPFDRSSPDITAHALRAWLAWLDEMPCELRERLIRAARRAIYYLFGAMEADESWLPLWFGNQHLPAEGNPSYGTGKILKAMVAAANSRGVHDRLSRGLTNAQLNASVSWTVRNRHPDDSWGASSQRGGSVEESAIVVEALAEACYYDKWLDAGNLQGGACRLIACIEDGTWTQPAPIGFYFAKLWYYERLYPMVFTVAALEAVARLEAAEK